MGNRGSRKINPEGVTSGNNPGGNNKKKNVYGPPGRDDYINIATHKGSLYRNTLLGDKGLERMEKIFPQVYKKLRTEDSNPFKDWGKNIVFGPHIAISELFSEGYDDRTIILVISFFNSLLSC